ncbi:MAG: hypothetical protein WCE61_16450, partial [Candidatus Acidiferrum sp.]
MNWKTIVKSAAVISYLMVGATACFAGDDLTVTKKITMGTQNVTAQTLVKGSRERTTMNMGGMQV